MTTKTAKPSPALESCPKCGAPVRLTRSKRKWADKAETIHNPNLGREYATCCRHGCSFYQWTGERRGRPATPSDACCPKCGKAADVRKSRKVAVKRGGRVVTNPNLGREYLACSDGACDYFEWAPKPMAPPPSAPARGTPKMEDPEDFEDAERAAERDAEPSIVTSPRGSVVHGAREPDRQPSPARKPRQLTLDSARDMFAAPGRR